MPGFTVLTFGESLVLKKTEVEDSFVNCIKNLWYYFQHDLYARRKKKLFAKNYIRRGLLVFTLGYYIVDKLDR